MSDSSLRLKISALTAVLATAVVVVPSRSHAESIQGALARAYQSNPELNAQRAITRAADESVPQALSGYRPKVNASANYGYVGQESHPFGRRYSADTFYSRSASVQIDQVIYNGNRTHNAVRGAESRVLGARETLRNAEQTILLNAATVYMNVLRDTALLNLQRNNIEVLTVQLNQTQDRFRVGEVTRTDVALAESALAKARSDSFVAEANLKTSIATYQQVVGEAPKKLLPAKPVENLLPKNRDIAIGISLREHPAVIAALHGVDQQALNVKSIEGELYPTLSVSATGTRALNSSGSGTALWQASIMGRLSVPIYEGGQTYSRVREAKETLASQRISVDAQRERVRQSVVSSWGTLEATRAQIKAAEAGVRAAEIALAGVREEAKVGQRTTLDVLSAQQSLLNARVSLVTFQRDRIVASYNVLAAVGGLSLRALGVNVAQYDPKVHYNQVRDKWIGLRTPDGQ